MSDLLRDGVWIIMESRRLCKTAGVLVRESRDRYRRHQQTRLQELMTLSEATDAVSRRRRAIVVRLVRQRGAAGTAARSAALHPCLRPLFPWSAPTLSLSGLP